MAGDDELPDEYVAEHLREAIATESGVHELGVSVTLVGSRVLLGGSASTPAQREAIGELVARLAPDREVVNDVEVPPVDEPAQTEELS